LQLSFEGQLIRWIKRRV